MPHQLKFWHCHVQLLGEKKSAVVNDLTFAELERQIIEPWHCGATFPVAGLVVRNRDEVQNIKITHTDRPQSDIAAEFDARSRANGVVDMATNRKMLPVWRGTDYTHELLFAELAAAAPEPEVGLVLRLCERLPAAARILANRQHGKAPFAIADEYDVQDLLHALLRGFLKYSVQEEPLCKVGAVRSGRADVAIEELGTIVEVKYVRGPSDQQRIIDEYSNDILLYTAWPHLKNFIYFIYNSDDLRDPEALDKLSGPQRINGVSFTSYIVRA